MEKLDTYRQHVQALLRERASVKSANSMIETQLVFDTERDHYQIVHTGWKNNVKRLYGCVAHVDVIDGKIWIQYDGFEEAIADQLVEMGVPAQDIVIAYHAPHARQYTEFAVE